MTDAQPARATGVADRRTSSDEEAFEQLKVRLHQRLLSELDPNRVARMEPAQVRAGVEQAIRSLLNSTSEAAVLSRAQRTRLTAELIDEVLGFGPLQPLLDDPTVSEIMVNSAKEVYVEREGVIHPGGRTFRDDAHVMQVVERILAPLGRRLDESSPMVDARLPGGYRLNAIIPPLALKGPSVTIRKFFDDRFGMEDLARIGTISEDVARLLHLAVAGRLNMVISGGTGTGKTTFLNALSAYIPPGERVVTIENPAELRLKQGHVVRLETRPPSIDGRNEVTQRALVVNALRMRPDRIIVGEVRAGEAFDMLQAMNTGHEGSLTTIHANSPRDALSRIENMVLMAGFDLPVRAIREQVSSAIHLFAHLARLRDGTRKVTHLTEVTGMEGQTITLQDVFVFRHEGVDREGRVLGRLVPTGIRPAFMDKLEQQGLMPGAELFVRRSLRS